MRCINAMLLLLSLSFVVSIPINIVDENRISTDEKILPVPNSINEEIVVFPNVEHPIEEVTQGVNEPEKSSESFTGPPLTEKTRKLLSIDDEENEESDFDDDDDFLGELGFDTENEHNLFLRPGAKPAPIPPNSPAGKAAATKTTWVPSTKRIIEDEDLPSLSSSRRLLISKAAMAPKAAPAPKPAPAPKAAPAPAPGPGSLGSGTFQPGQQ